MELKNYRLIIINVIQISVHWFQLNNSNQKLNHRCLTEARPVLLRDFLPRKSTHRAVLNPTPSRALTNRVATHTASSLKHDNPRTGSTDTDLFYLISAARRVVIVPLIIDTCYLIYTTNFCAHLLITRPALLNSRYYTH